MSRVASGSARVNRGGSWGFVLQSAWVIRRSFGAPGHRFTIVGLRLVRRLP